MNLIICYTPLQVLVAEKIIEEHPKDIFFGVMLCSVDNPKFTYYTERLAEKCSQHFSLLQRTDRIGLLRQIIELKCQFRGKSFKKVFLASINDIEIQFILSAIKFNSLYTFDDGTANIVPSSLYYQSETNTFIRKMINFLLNNRFTMDKIKSVSQCHYTIFPQFKNIIPTIKPLSLNLSANTIVEKNENRPIHLLLGQPVYLERQKNIETANAIIKRFNIEYYLPHPREQYKIDNVNYIDTPFIFEDYITQVSVHQKYRIYTYFSSAVLNVKDNPNLEIISLQIDVSNPDYIECYHLLSQAGIPIIDLRR